MTVPSLFDPVDEPRREVAPGALLVRGSSGCSAMNASIRATVSRQLAPGAAPGSASRTAASAAIVAAFASVTMLLTCSAVTQPAAAASATTAATRPMTLETILCASTFASSPSYCLGRLCSRMSPGWPMTLDMARF